MTGARYNNPCAFLDSSDLTGSKLEVQWTSRTRVRPVTSGSCRALPGLWQINVAQTFITTLNSLTVCLLPNFWILSMLTMCVLVCIKSILPLYTNDRGRLLQETFALLRSAMPSKIFLECQPFAPQLLKFTGRSFREVKDRGTATGQTGVFLKGSL